MTDTNDQNSPGIMMIPSVDAPVVPAAAAPLAPPPAAVFTPVPVPPPAVAPVAPVVVAAPVAPAPAPVAEAPAFDIANIDVAICIDTSGTMGKTIPPSGMTRLQAAKESTVALAAEAEKYDGDGITVVKFAGKVRLFDGVTSSKVEQIFLEFRPMGSTNTRDAVDTVGKLFLAKRAAAGAAAKPGCIVVITDGEPDDKVGLAQVIVNLSKQINDRSELGILFVQVGDEPDATSYLAKLNNDLTSAGAKFDIVAVCHLDDLEDLSPAEIFEQAFTD